MHFNDPNAARSPRMTFATLLQSIQKDAAFFEELARFDAIGAELHEGKLRLRNVLDVRMSPGTQRRVQVAKSMGCRCHINYWLQMQIAIGGPKIFRPSLDQCLAMEQVAPKIAVGDYAQPFPVMVIDLPEEYQKRRACGFGSSHGIPQHAPAYLIVGAHGHPPWTIWLHIGLDTNVGVQWALMPTDATIEEGIVREFGSDSYLPADLPSKCFGHEERLVVAGLLRLAVNAMLLLTDLGCRHLGPLNPGHHRRLEKYASLARKRSAGVIDANRNLRLAPQLYGFPRDIVLHHEQRVGAESSGAAAEDALHRRPHWRRGHWKTHAFGAGLSERKRVFIKPVLVNRHLLREGQGVSAPVYRVTEGAP